MERGNLSYRIMCDMESNNKFRHNWKKVHSRRCTPPVFLVIMDRLDSLGEIYYDILNFSNLNVVMRRPKKWHKGRVLVFYFFLTFAISSVIFLTYSSLWASADFYIYTYNICNWIQQLQCVIKIMYFTIKRDTLGSVMMKFGEFYNCKIRPRLSVEILELRVENIRKMNKLYYFATWCTCLLYAGFPILQSFFGWNKSDTVNKILPTVYPFDISETPAYEIIYVYEFIECITIAVLLPAVDIFFCSVGYLLCTQLLLIQKSILPIDTNSIEQNISESDLQGIPIKSFIEDHTIVLKMCNSLRDMVSPLLLLQLLVSVTTFSFVIYRLTYVDTESDTFLYFVDGAKAAMYFVTTFIQFAPYCWISNELQQANEDVGFAVYCTNWYERDSNFRNSVRMIQLQSNKEISMNALKLLKVNLNTIVDILKLSYSYYTLLSQISKE